MLAPGDAFGDRYRIVRLLGEGSMGAVYEGENVPIRRKVAIKVLHAEVSQHRDTVQRFEREAQAAGRIGSEHIVEVLDGGELPDGSRYMVMELLEGTTLADRIHARGRLTPHEVAPIAHELLGGLAAAHDKSIIHRDLKPANVFLVQVRAGQPDFVKILDFGVSKFNALNADQASMTSTGVVLGTPYYMSPEQAKGARTVDSRSDLYAVGVILYECLTGHVPFAAETFNELLFKIVLESPPPAESYVPDLDPSFAAILRKSMERDPGARFQSAFEFQQALGDWIIRQSSIGGRVAPSLQAAVAGAQTARIPLAAMDAAWGQPLHALGPAPGVRAPGPGGTVLLDLPPPSARQPGVAAPESVDLPMARGSAILPVALFAAALLAGGAAAAFLLLRDGPAPATSVKPVPSAVDTTPQDPPSAEATAPASAPPEPASSEPPTRPRSPEPEPTPRKKSPSPRASAAPTATASAAPTAVPTGRHISDDL